MRVLGQAGARLGGGLDDRGISLEGLAERVEESKRQDGTMSQAGRDWMAGAANSRITGAGAFQAVVLGSVVGVLSACGTVCRRDVFEPVVVDTLQFAGAHWLVPGASRRGPELWMEKFSFIRRSGGQFQCQVSGKGRTVSPRELRGEAVGASEWAEYTLETWGGQVTPGGVELSGERPRSRCIPFLDLPEGRLCVGDRFPTCDGYMAEVIGFDVVQMFDGTIDGCAMVSYRDGLGQVWRLWFAPGIGPVRVEARVRGALVVAGAMYVGEVPDVLRVVEFFDWPAGVLERVKRQAD